MTNKHASKQHGLVGQIRPKSKDRKRRNKARAAELREARRTSATTAKPEAKKTVKEETTATE